MAAPGETSGWETEQALFLDGSGSQKRSGGARGARRGGVLVQRVAIGALALAATLALRRRRQRQRPPPPPPSSWLTGGGSSAGAADPSGLAAAAEPATGKAPGAGERAHAPQAAGAARRRLLAAALGLLSAAAAAAVVALLVARGAPELAALAAAAWILQLLHLWAEPPAVNGARGGGGSGGAVAVTAAAAGVHPPAPAAARLPLPPIAGTWVKDHAASDSMDQIMELMRMNGLLRTAIRLLRGLEIRLSEKEFSFGVFSLVKWFKVAESYTMDGAVCSARRRDLRGRMRGAARLTPHGTLLLSYEWDAPCAGRGEDEFVVSGGRLLVIHTNWVAGQEVKYTEVYTRA